MKTYVAFVRDHSGSMQPIQNGAMEDYNLILSGLKQQVTAIHEVYGTVTGCGVGWSGDVQRLENLKHIRDMNPLISYNVSGGATPLWESVMTAINSIEFSHRGSGLIENVAYLVIVTTDGQNNRHNVSAKQLSQRISELQSTDKWTFVFRVPKGDKQTIVNLGIPEGNVVEWEQTTTGVKKVAEVTSAAIPAYFAARTRGLTSTQSFYTDLSTVPLAEVKQELTDITSELQSHRVWTGDAGKQIRPFCENYFGEYKLGSAFYQLMKTEKLQPYKKIIIKHLKSGKYYGGSEARTVLGLPDNEEIRVKPGDHGQYEIYVQSTSVNRKLIVDTNVVYWINV